MKEVSTRPSSFMRYPMPSKKYLMDIISLPQDGGKKGNL
jgi:hypothetical protein